MEVPKLPTTLTAEQYRLQQLGDKKLDFDEDTVDVNWHYQMFWFVEELSDILARFVFPQDDPKGLEYPASAAELNSFFAKYRLSYSGDNLNGFLTYIRRYPLDLNTKHQQLEVYVNRKGTCTNYVINKKIYFNKNGIKKSVLVTDKKLLDNMKPKSISAFKEENMNTGGDLRTLEILVH